MADLAPAHADDVASTGQRLAILRAIEKKLLWLSSWTIHHANHLRAEPGQAEGRRPPGVLRLGRQHHDRAVLRRAAPRRPGRGQAAREPDLPCRHAPARPRADRAAAEFPGAGRGAVLPVAHQGPVRRRLLDRLGRPGCGDDPVRLADPGLCRACTAWARPASRPGGWWRSSATPSSTRATSTRPCSRAGSTTSAISGG